MEKTIKTALQAVPIVAAIIAAGILLEFDWPWIVIAAVIGGAIFVYILLKPAKTATTTPPPSPSTPAPSRIPAWLSWGKQQQLIAVVAFWMIVIGVIIYFVSGVVADAKSGNYEKTGTPVKFFHHPELVYDSDGEMKTGRGQRRSREITQPTEITIEGLTSPVGIRVTQQLRQFVEYRDARDDAGGLNLTRNKLASFR